MSTEDAIDYSKKLTEIMHQRTMRMNSAAINACGAVIENVLERFYREVWGYLTPEEKLRLASLETSFGKKSPLKTLSLGRWVEFYSKADLPNLLYRTLSIPEATFDLPVLQSLVKTRNRCEHEGYIPSPEEAAEMETFTQKLLLGTRLVKEIPRPYLPNESKPPAADPRLIELTNRIRLILSSRPHVEFNDEVEDEHDPGPGKSYWVDSTWEFLGAYADEKIIHLLMWENVSVMHEEITDTAYNLLFNRLWKPVAEANLDLKGVKVSVDILVGDKPAWGNAFLEVEY